MMNGFDKEMPILKVLSEIGMGDTVSAANIQGGRDSTVFQVFDKSGRAFAVRMKPGDHLQRYLYEKTMMETAQKHGIPGPHIFQVAATENYTFMVMEWFHDHTLFHFLQTQPQKAEELGIQFGMMQAKIHQIDGENNTIFQDSTWLSSKTEGNWQSLLMKEGGDVHEKRLLHLDYHPLNVFTDGSKITGVIDWANASNGKPAFDVARTLSLIQLMGSRFINGSNLLQQFEKGWKKGYKQAGGNLNIPPIYYIWAGNAMKLDLKGTLSEEEIAGIDDWIKFWKRK